MNSQLKGYIATICSAIIFGCVPLCSKLIYAEGLTPMSLIFFRSVIVLPMLLIAIKANGEQVAISKSDFCKIIFIAIFGIVLTPLFLFTSYQYISSGTATVFHYIYPATVIVGGAIFCKEKIEKNSLFCLILCTVGIAMFYSPSEKINLKGAIFALVSGIVYATYIILLSKNKLENISRYKLSFYMFGIGAVLMFPICLVTKNFIVPKNTKTWLLCILFAFLACFLAYVLFQIGTQNIGGGKSSILSTFEPITSLIVGYFVFNESISVFTLIGSVFVISSSILIAYFDMKDKR